MGGGNGDRRRDANSTWRVGCAGTQAGSASRSCPGRWTRSGQVVDFDEGGAGGGGGAGDRDGVGAGREADEVKDYFGRLHTGNRVVLALELLGLVDRLTARSAGFPTPPDEVSKTLSLSYHAPCLRCRFPNPKSPQFAGRVLVAKREPLARSAVCGLVRQALGAGAETVACDSATSVLAVLGTEPIGLAIVGLGFADFDGLDLVAELVSERRIWRLLVLSSRRDEHTLTSLSAMRVPLLAATSDLEFEAARSAIVRVAAGNPSPGDARPALRHGTSPTLAQMFSAYEQLIFALIGDGSGDAAVAHRLGSCPNTVRWHRQRIMAKLGVTCRTGLMREALGRGVVRFEGARTVHPGFERSLAQFRQRDVRATKPAA